MESSQLPDSPPILATFQDKGFYLKSLIVLEQDMKQSDIRLLYFKRYDGSLVKIWNYIF